MGFIPIWYGSILNRFWFVSGSIRYCFGFTYTKILHQFSTGNKLIQQIWTEPQNWDWYFTLNQLVLAKKNYKTVRSAQIENPIILI